MMHMMKHRFLALLFLLLAGTAQDLFAQDYPPVPVTVSRSQVNMNGKTYYAHIVLERQTIYGITKAYGVTEEDLYAANPMLKQEGLKAGTVLYVPTVSEQKASQATPASVKEKPVEKEKPAAKEKPAVKEEKPAAVREQPAPKENKPVVIDTKPAPTPNADGIIEHTVKWFEDLYGVAKTYGVTPEEIMAANGLKSSRISKRQTLLIPVTDKARESIKSKLPSVQVPVEEKPATVPAQQVPVQAETPVVEQPDPETKPEETEPSEGILDWLSGATGKGSADLALILPFNAAGKTSETNMDFYSGVLMALRDLEKQGVKTTLNVFDLQAGIPSSFDLGKNDFILGPITSSDLSTILGVTGGRVPIVSPLDQRAADLADTHEGFIQAPSSADSQYTELAAWAAEECVRGDQIILVTEKTSNGSTAAAVGVREALLDAGTAFEGVSWTQGEGRSLPASLTARLAKSGVNRIIVASEKEAFVSDLVRNLGILLGRGYKIVLYAPSRVRTFESIDSSNYHQCFLHICSPYFADYDAENVKAFVRSYRALYRTEPSQFAFQGYDLTRYFASLVAKYGNRWTRALRQVDGSGIHTDFHFEPARTGSYRNTAIRRIVYNTDYTTELVR
jgi:LysM repeat protein/ABC-type branched-subunit amino acid transport system substrate-binding protein